MSQDDRDAIHERTPRPVSDRDVPVQDGSLQPQVPVTEPPPVHVPASGRDGAPQRSGVLCRPFDRIDRVAVRAGDAQTELEKYKVRMRKYAPVQIGRDALPWAGWWQCDGCDARVSGALCHDAERDTVYLRQDCPTCGERRTALYDVLFVKQPRGLARHARQPERTFGGVPIRPILTTLPRTVETLCPECACLILGRYYVRDKTVYIEKTCPEHGYFRDKINTDVALYLRATEAGYQDERGAERPQVKGGSACPTDCGLCEQHHSTSCLAQIDLTNRCNLNCPVCFASANSAGYVAEPTYEMVVEMLRSLRRQDPHPATAIQFTGGEPTLHPDFFRIVKTAVEMGFSHVQIATNGLRIAERSFAERAAEAGLHTLYLQFDGLDDADYVKLRGVRLLEKKMQVIENCRATGMKICFVPTIVNGVNDHQVERIFRCAVDNIDVVSAISYQPVSFSGRISREQLEQQRYTLGDLAHDVAACSGADLQRDFFPLNFMTPLSRILQTIDGKPKIRPSCHSDCAFGTYFFVTPDRQVIPVPKLFDMARLMDGFNDLAARIERTRPEKMANWRDKLDILLTFLRSYRWSERDFRVTPFTFAHTLRGLTDKAVGRGASGTKTFRTLMAAGMHFMDRYNFDTERIKRCVILYSTPDGMYPFCTINCGPTYRPYIEQMYARPLGGPGRT